MAARKLNALLRDKKKQDFFIYGFGQAFNLVSPLLVAPYVVLVCREEGLGKSGLGFALALFLILIVDYSFDIKGTKKVSENRDDVNVLSKIINTAIFTKILLFLITVAIAAFLVWFVPFFEQEQTLFVLSMAIVMAQVFNPIWFLQGIENFRWVTIVNIGSKTLYIILVFVLVRAPGDYIYVNLFLGLSALVFNLIGLVYIKYKFGFDIVFPKANEVVSILRADFTFCLSQLFLSARQLSPLVLTGYFLGFQMAGIYKIIEQVITLFRTFIQVYLKFFYAAVCYRVQLSAAEGFDFWKRYSSRSFALVLIALVAMYFIAPDILRFFNMEESFIAQMTTVFRFSLPVSLLMAVSLPLEQLMFVTDRSKIYIRITIFVTVVNVLLISLLIRQWELYGIIASLLVSEVLFISLYFSKAYLHLKSRSANVSHI